MQATGAVRAGAGGAPDVSSVHFGKRDLGRLDRDAANHGRGARQLTVAYRIKPALTAELMESPTHHGNEVLLDQHGRPLAMLYGLVTPPVSVGGRDVACAGVERTAVPAHVGRTPHAPEAPRGAPRLGRLPVSPTGVVGCHAGRSGAKASSVR